MDISQHAMAFDIAGKPQRFTLKKLPGYHGIKRAACGEGTLFADLFYRTCTFCGEQFPEAKLKRIQDMPLAEDEAPSHLLQAVNDGDPEYAQAALVRNRQKLLAQSAAAAAPLSEKENKAELVTLRARKKALEEITSAYRLSGDRVDPLWCSGLIVGDGNEKNGWRKAPRSSMLRIRQSEI